MRGVPVRIEFGSDRIRLSGVRNGSLRDSKNAVLYVAIAADIHSKRNLASSFVILKSYIVSAILSCRKDTWPLKYVQMLFNRFRFSSRKTAEVTA